MPWLSSAGHLLSFVLHVQFGAIYSDGHIGSGNSAMHNNTGFTDRGLAVHLVFLLVFIEVQLQSGTSIATRSAPCRADEAGHLNVEYARSDHQVLHR